MIIFTNLTEQINAGTIEESIQHTIIARLVQNEFGQLKENELIEESFNEKTIQHQSSYLKNNTALKKEPKATMNSIDETEIKNEIAHTTYNDSAIIKPEITSTKKTKQARKETITYKIKTGDSVSTIASEFGISVNTILWENNLNSYSLIRAGQTLKILPITGITHKIIKGENLSKISKQYGISESKIMIANKITNKNKLSVNQKLIIPNGQKIKYATTSKSRYSGISAIKDLVKPNRASPVASNKMNWPTQGHRITQYYSWRHHGLDIANKTGTPLYAADTGTIEYAGWSSGYGNNIVINHGGGKKTRYAHLSKFYVKKGNQVKKGESIGGMGSTGWSTGSHLHFEVIINGRKYNPLNYIR